MFRINIIFDSMDREKWADGYKKYHGYNETFIERYYQFRDEVIDTIVRYKLPVITLGKETPREAVCKVFENVNTGGVPLTVFELVTATFATYDFDLRKDWIECRDKIRGKGETLNTDVMEKAEIDETELRFRIESHLVNYDYLIADDFDHYFIARAKEILKVIEEAMGKTIADKGSEQTIKEYGCSLDDTTN